MGGASSQSLLCYRVSAQHNVILTWAKETLWLAANCNDAFSWVFGNKHETAKMFCKIFDFYKG